MPKYKLWFLLNQIQNLFRKTPKPAQDPALRSPLMGPDGQLVVDGANFVTSDHIYGYNINPDILQGDIKPGKYLIVAGTVLELLQCEAPVGYAPFRWPAFDSPDRVGHIWVHVNALTHLSGNFGIRE